ncbi:MAG: hypothetical protein JXA14_02840 [Anaerolineae bacterium]|jgi:hypothetical protein|nr:hypothetical protein [Anaerolineae bacterium]
MFDGDAIVCPVELHGVRVVVERDGERVVASPGQFVGYALGMGVVIFNVNIGQCCSSERWRAGCGR